MEKLKQDLRYALRVLIQKPAFTAVTITALALGIAATTAIFSVVNSVLLRPLPFNDPDRLMLIWTKSEPDLPQNWVSGPEVIDFRERSQLFEEFAVMNWPSLSLTGGGDPEQVQAGAVTANFLSVLGVEPAYGRAFLPEEDQPGADRVAILSHGLWQRRYGGNPEIVSQSIVLNGQNTTVVGIMPPDFGILPPDPQSPRNIELWAPLAVDLNQLARSNHGFRVIGRLKPGVTPRQGQAEMQAIGAQMNQEFYESRGFGATAVPLLGHVVRNVRPALMLLLAAVAFVLLIACANVANLLLARSAAREREIALRAALGATRFRIARQLLTESVVLAFAGGLAGILLAYVGLEAILALAPEDIPRLAETSIDARVLVFALGVTLVTGVTFGLAPALQCSKPNVNESLKEGGRAATSGSTANRVRNFLVVAEIALAFVLVIGAGLMIRSFMGLVEKSPGFNPQNLLTARLILPQSAYPENEHIAFHRQLLERLRALPGVDAAGSISHLPLSGAYTSGTMTVEDPPTDQVPASFEADRRAIDTDYFKAMGIPLIDGRFFTDHDLAEATAVVIVDRTFARRFWADGDPLGKRVKLGGNQSTAPWLTIVGVVENVRHYTLNEDGRETVYFPYSQLTWAARSMFVTARSTGDPSALAGAVRAEVSGLNPGQPVFNMTQMEDLVFSAISAPRFNMLLLGTFSVVALVLAAVGVYGVIHYSVAQRTHEIGIRMALGAGRTEIMTMVFRRGLVLMAAGVAAGLAGAYALTRVMSSLLFGVTATDPLTFVLVSLVMLLVSAAATFIPALRATRVDPMAALHVE